MKGKDIASQNRMSHISEFTDWNFFIIKGININPPVQGFQFIYKTEIFTITSFYCIINLNNTINALH